MGNSPEAGLQQLDFGMSFVATVSGRVPAWLTSIPKVLLITMGLSFGIADYIEGGVISAVIMLNIIVG